MLLCPHMACAVLIVEDDLELSDMMSQLLMLEGFETRTAANGDIALTLLREGPRPDVIVLDLMMPVMDGWRFREHQIHDPALADVPVIVLSAAHDLRPVHANAVLSKPLDVDRLITALRAHCR
jgi:CheY-like chemotaxis protein